jgi:glycerol-3-phosphate acyltransferase PlsY
VLLGLAPVAAAVGFLVWVVLLLATRYVSVASIGAALAIPAAGWVLYRAQGPLMPGALTALGLVAVWRHKANIRRLLNGTELRFGKRGRGKG